MKVLQSPCCIPFILLCCLLDFSIELQGGATAFFLRFHSRRVSTAQILILHVQEFGALEFSKDRGTVLATGIAALHVRIMRVSLPYCAQFTRKLRARYTRVKKYTKLCVNNYTQILHSACKNFLKNLHAEFRVKEGRIFTVVHQFVAAFLEENVA